MNPRRYLPVLVGMSLFVSGGVAYADAAYDWTRTAPTEAGFPSDVGERLDRRVQDGEFTNLHAVIVARDGKLAIERYYDGADERRGERLPNVEFGPEVKHDLRSVTKSIVGLLYGIALAEGRVPALDQPLIDQFPDYEDLAADPQRRRMTVGHALTMTLGTDWDENLPYTDPRNSETAMDMAADRYRYVLERPFVAEPGSRWTYNGGATALLAYLITEGTGKPLLTYAREKLFEPLGITDVDWIAGPDGRAIAASGLRMRPLDLAKIGQLILDRGVWGDTRIVPAEWLDQSFTPQVKTGGELDYGYHWWLGRSRSADEPWIGAFGNGGQRLFVLPSDRLAVVITAGNYNKPDQNDLPIAVMSKVVMPALRGN